jgi:hypothetical protein
VLAGGEELVAGPDPVGLTLEARPRASRRYQRELEAAMAELRTSVT